MKTRFPRLLKAVAGFSRRYIIILLVIGALVLGYRLGGVGRASSQEPAAPAAGSEQKTAASDKKTQIWTCSMHPQIRRYEPGLCPICNMPLIPLAEAQAEGLRKLTVSEEAAKLMDVEVTPVERKFVSADVRMVGKADYDETNLSYITAWIPGRLDRLFVDYTGVTVQKGDHMVSLYSPELISAQEELLQAVQAVKNIAGSDSAMMRRVTDETVKAARDKLRLWGLTSDQIAEIESTGKVQDHMTIYAPAGGIVIHKNALEGMYVQTGTRIYTIADLSKVWVKLDAYESDLAWLRYGQEVQFTTVSYPGQTFKGVISFIAPVLDEKTRTVKVRVNVPNADGRLKPGMFVKAVVSSEIAEGGRVMDADMIGKWICPMHPEVVKDKPGRCDICDMPLVTTESLGYVGPSPEASVKPLVIPASAALVTGTRAVVYVKVPGAEKPTFEGREILLGPRAGDYYLVRSGVKEGELVVTKGNFKIDSSLQISAKPSMMTPDAMPGTVHQHGGAMPQMKGAMPAPALPPLAASQITNVITAADSVQRAIAQEQPDEARAAFGCVADALDAVDMESMSGDTHALWMEYRMRLRNDALEGSQASTMDDLKRVADSLRQNVDAMVGKLGLTKETTAGHQEAISKTFQTQLQPLFADYLAMQAALADDNAATAKAAAGQVRRHLGQVDKALLQSSLQDTWTKMADDVGKSVEDVDAHDDIVKLREDFHLLTQPVIAIARRFGAVGDGPLYVIHCPMAFNNRGADWLQATSDIHNPYFGKTMLTCGEIKEVIGPKPIWQGDNGTPND